MFNRSQIAVVEDNLMYWGDSGLHKIERANLDGSQRTLLWSSTTARYYAMALDSTFIYFTDWTVR
jgi:Low-density lipoprotein receptor repeat class B